MKKRNIIEEIDENKGYHEEGIGGLYESFKLVLSLLMFCGWVQQINVILENLKTTKLNRNRNSLELEAFELFNRNEKSNQNSHHLLELDRKP